LRLSPPEAISLIIAKEDIGLPGALLQNSFAFSTLWQAAILKVVM
jgi:hypothetical protein